MAKYKFRKSKTISYTTDSSFLNRVKSGDENAWSDFYNKYSGMIRSIGQKHFLTPEECDDLTVEVMTIFWKKMEEFIYDRSRGMFRSYLGRITNYCAMKIFAIRRKHLSVLRNNTADYPDDVDTRIMDEWRDFLFNKAMEELKESVDTETYQVFYMSFIQHCPVDEISAITRKTSNNIYVIRSRCLAKLTALIKQYRQFESELSGSHSHKKSEEY